MQEVEVGSSWIHARTCKRYQVTDIRLRIDAKVAKAIIYYKEDGASLSYSRPADEWLALNRDGVPRFAEACCIKGCCEPHANWPGDDGQLCQEHWEDACAVGFWEMVKGLEGELWAD